MVANVLQKKLFFNSQQTPSKKVSIIFIWRCILFHGEKEIILDHVRVLFIALKIRTRNIKLDMNERLHEVAKNA